MSALSKLGVSERAAFRLVDCPRATIQDVSRREPDDPAVIDSMHKIASQRLRFGRRRVHFLMGREGFDISELDSVVCIARIIYKFGRERNATSNTSVAQRD